MEGANEHFRGASGGGKLVLGFRKQYLASTTY